MVKYSLQPRVLHQTELHSISVILEGWVDDEDTVEDHQPVPHEDGGGLQSGDRHLEVLVSADSEPLGRVQELVLVDQVQGAASLGDDQPDNSWS